MVSNGCSVHCSDTPRHSLMTLETRIEENQILKIEIDNLCQSCQVEKNISHVLLFNLR